MKFLVTTRIFSFRMIRKYIGVRRGAQMVPMLQSFICMWFLQLNTKLFKIRINDRKAVITFVAIVFIRKLSRDVFTAFIPSEFGILKYKDFAILLWINFSFSNLFIMLCSNSLFAVAGSFCKRL